MESRVSFHFDIFHMYHYLFIISICIIPLYLHTYYVALSPLIIADGEDVLGLVKHGLLLNSGVTVVTV